MGQYLDLSKIDFEALKKQFEKSRKHIEAEKLRGLLNAKLLRMMRLNRSRMDYYQKFQQLIDEYNSGAKNVDAFYAELISLAQELNEEEQRGIAENLIRRRAGSVRPAHQARTQAQPQRARSKSKQSPMSCWTRSKPSAWCWIGASASRARAAVQLEIQKTLDKLPQAYDTDLYQQKCQLVYQHVYDSYYGAGRSIYTPLAA